MAPRSRNNNSVPAVESAVVGGASLELAGHKYRLVYDYNAIADAEKEAGCNLLHGISATLLNTMTAAQLRGLLYAALRRHHPKVTLRDAGLLIEIETMPEIVKAILEAYGLSRRPAKENPTQAAGEVAPAAN